MIHEGGWTMVHGDAGEVLVLPPVPDYVRRARAPADPVAV